MSAAVDHEFAAPAALITVRQIVHTVGEHYGVHPDDIRSHRLGRHLVWPRHVACGLAVRLTDYSYPRIGRIIGGRNHASIMYARRVFERRVASDEEAADHVGRIERRLRSGDAPVQAELAAVERELEERLRELRRIDVLVEAGERRLAGVAASFALITAARRLARAEGQLRATLWTGAERNNRTTRDRMLDQLVRAVEAAHV